ncbi:hypothetical protein ACSSS7_006999 [Eimeria intestinalis]
MRINPGFFQQQGWKESHGTGVARLPSSFHAVHPAHACIHHHLSGLATAAHGKVHASHADKEKEMHFDERTQHLLLRPASETPGGKERRQLLRLGHPWIFDYEVENIRFFNKQHTGRLLSVFDSDGTFIGEGLFSRQAAIVLRILNHSQISNNSTSNSSNSSNNSSSSSNSSNSSSNIISIGEKYVRELFRSRFLDALKRRGFTPEIQRNIDSSSNSSSSNSSSSNSSNSSSSNSSSSNSSSSNSRSVRVFEIGSEDVWRAVDGEADGLPGIDVDVFGSREVEREE